MGILKKIAVTPRQLQPMELISKAEIRVDEGIVGDARGGNKTRQVSVLFEEDWLAACEDLNASLPWESRRAGLLVNGAENPKALGARISIGDVILEVTEETKPCQLMEKVKPGLRQALAPDWRGGVCCRVVQGGHIAQGDHVEITLPA